jgi:hypothetical protein
MGVDEPTTALGRWRAVHWVTRGYDLTYPRQDASPGSGGLGPLPKSNLLVKITRRQRSASQVAAP